MTTKKHPVTVASVGEAIFQLWRNGQNATVESVMKALASSHRQKVNDLMAEGRVSAGEMIQAREAESQLEGDFPAEAFCVIRDWAKTVAELRLQDWEASLKDRETELVEQRQAMNIELQAAQQQIAGFEIETATLRQQLADLQVKSEQDQAAQQAKCDGLEQALAEARERAGQAEARLDVTAQTLAAAQTDLHEQKARAERVSKQRDELNQHNKQLSEQAGQLNQQAEDLRGRLTEAEHRHQNREAQWLTERDERVRKEALGEQRLLQQEEQILALTDQCQAFDQALSRERIDKDVLKRETDRLQQAHSLVVDQKGTLEDQAKQKDGRLIDLERQNAALLAEIARNTEERFAQASTPRSEE